MTESIFTGPGEVLLAPETWGDIVPIRLDGAQDWRVGRDAFLACTMGVARTTKSQGFGKALCTSRLSLFALNLNKCAGRRGEGVDVVFGQSRARACSCTTSAGRA